MALELQLLGPIEATLDGRPICWAPRRQRAVLAMLALQVNRTVSVDRLVEGLWGTEPPDSAPKMVQLYVSNLRKALAGDAAEIRTHGRGYELDSLPRLWTRSASKVSSTPRRGRGDGAAREALVLWRGDALSDLADEPFAAAEIRRLEELWMRATELAIDQDLAAGRHAELIGELEALVEAHPLQERLHIQRMVALYRSGRQAEALEAYRQARRVLVEEIGVEPGLELRRMHDAVLRQDAALDAPAEAPAPDAEPGGAGPAPLRVVSRARPRRAVIVALALAIAGGVVAFAVSRWTASDGIARIDENMVGSIDRDGTSRTSTRSAMAHGDRRRRRISLGRQRRRRNRLPSRSGGPTVTIPAPRRPGGPSIRRRIVVGHRPLGAGRGAE